MQLGGRVWRAGAAAAGGVAWPEWWRWQLPLPGRAARCLQEAEKLFDCEGLQGQTAHVMGLLQYENGKQLS